MNNRKSLLYEIAELTAKYGGLDMSDKEIAKCYAIAATGTAIVGSIKSEMLAAEAERIANDKD